MSLQQMEARQTHYLRRLTDDTGIFQHTKFGVPDRTQGYTTDDNARALIAAVLLYKDSKDEGALDLLYIYISFIHHSQNDHGYFKNFMDYNRIFREEKGSEDCLGRTLWALGFALSETSVPPNLHNTCRYLINQALPNVETLRSPRAMAYAMIGLTYLLETPDSLSYSFPYPQQGEDEDPSFLPRDVIYNVVGQLAEKLHLQYKHNSTEGWHWFEDSMTYGNAMLPWAMFKSARLMMKDEWRETGKATMDFLVSKTFSDKGYFKPIGSHGWLIRGGDGAALYDEQPIEACEMMLACLEAYRELGDDNYREYASLCYEWYNGRNSLGVSLIDPQSGGCYDGIHATGLNLNQGSENIISYTIAQLVMRKE